MNIKTPPLDTLSVCELRLICRSKKLKRYAKLRKPQLIELIRNGENNIQYSDYQRRTGRGTMPVSKKGSNPTNIQTGTEPKMKKDKKCKKDCSKKHKKKPKKVKKKKPKRKSKK